MQYTSLGKTGLKVSKLGFGGIPIQRVDVGAACSILAACGEEGVNFIDTARMYGDSEEKIGSFFKTTRRQDWVLATKSMARDYQGMLKDVDISLKNIGVDEIELYQLHNVATMADLERIMAEDGALAALEECRRQGKIRHIGITGHKTEILEPAVDSGRFATLQVPFSALERQALPLLEKAVVQYSMGTIAMKPLSGGAIHLARPAIARLLEEKLLDTAIPGMDSVEQVRENCGILSNPPSPQEFAQLDKLLAGLDNNFCRRCEYCQPCPRGLKIPAMFLFHGYYVRYNLQDWARERYATLPTKASECDECGVCESRCPYDLPIRRMLEETAAALEQE
jgi:predicted aldo/keto reductase-like oxidoreductase